MTPTTEDELATAIKDASAGLRITGGGTRGIGSVQGDDLSLAGLSGITTYDPGALTIVAKAGTPVAEIKAALAVHHQQLAFEPMDHRGLLQREGTPTIGGVVAANVSGSRRIAVGACRDFMLGVRFVDGAGRVTSNGGRVMKNVTGYDLVKLMCGSFGTLGVLTEVSLKVLPMPGSSATLMVPGLAPARAVAAMSDALGSPYEVTGAAYDGETVIRIEGFPDSVAYRLQKLQGRLSAFGEVQVLDQGASEARWARITNVDALCRSAGDLWRISVRPSDAPAVLKAISPNSAVLDWGSGLIWADVDQGTDLRSAMASFNGHATLIRGQGGPTFHPQPDPLAAISAGLRAKFDPRGILNPGLMD